MSDTPKKFIGARINGDMFADYEIIEGKLAINRTKLIERFIETIVEQNRDLLEPKTD